MALKNTEKLLLGAVTILSVSNIILREEQKKLWEELLSGYELVNDVMQNNVEVQKSINNSIDSLADTQLEIVGDISEYENSLNGIKQEISELFSDVEELKKIRAERVSASTYSANELSEAEITLLAQLVESEARGEIKSGKIAVIHTVRNRMELPQYPDSVGSVITQQNQFSESHILHTYLVTDSDKELVREAWGMGDITGGSIFFWNPHVATNRWLESRQAVKWIGNHQFLR